MCALAALLQEELANRDTRFPEGARTFDEVRAERKKGGLSYGRYQTRKFLQRLQRQGKVEYLRGHRVRGSQVLPVVKYLFK